MGLCVSLDGSKKQQKSDENPSQILDENPEKKLQDNPLQNPEQKIDQNLSQKLEENPQFKIDIKPQQKLDQSPSQKIQDKTQSDVSLLIKKGYKQTPFLPENVSNGYKPLIKPNQEMNQQIPEQIINAVALQYTEEKVFEEDTRKQVKDCLQYPYSAIGLLTFRLDSRKATGTGFLIGSNIVLTAAHNIYDHKLKKECQDFIFCPAFKQNVGRTYKVKKFHYLNQYKTAQGQRRKQLDYGIIQLQENAGENYGFFGLDFNSVEVGEIEIYGYPSYIFEQKYQKSPVSAQKRMYGAAGMCTKYKNQRLLYQIPTSPGQSGSPIYKLKNGKPYVIGIHTNGEDCSFNSGVLLTQDKRIKINQWVGFVKRELLLPASQINKQKIKILGQKLKDLKRVNLWNNKIGPEGANYISKAQWPNLTSISLYGNKIGPEGANYISKAQWPNLASINLDSNKIGDEGANYISKAQWPYLSSIHLSSNKIGDEGAHYISKAHWFNLSSIHLKFNDIGDEGADYILNAQWSNLTYIYLDQNNIGVEQTQRLKSSFPRVYF